jgi:E3 ubiquitin-protein ligase UHRF1
MNDYSSVFRLDAVPDDDWYCPECRNDASEIVAPGTKMAVSKKKAKMASSQGNGKKRNWGNGMATAGRTKMCTKVPPNHFGPIPGIEVGMSWKFRLQVSEEGVHRRHVGGIAGDCKAGATSIALSGGFVEDYDYGKDFLYTGKTCKCSS